MYEAGLSPAQARRETLATLLLYRQGYARRKRREEIQIIGLRNEVRGFAGGEPLDVDDLYDTSPSSASDEKELQAFKHRIRTHTDFDWEEDLTE